MEPPASTVSLNACASPGLVELPMTATRESRPTKEYPKGQEVYALTFRDAEPEAP